MPLLVSVRSADEVEAALAGGADIIDAKDPARGSLGAVTPDVLAAVAARVPEPVPLSVALGDPAAAGEVRRAIEGTAFLQRSAPVYLKLGFAGVPAGPVQSLLEAAVDGASHATSPRIVVAVAYADHAAAAAPPVDTVVSAARASGVAGLLVDTWGKDGRGLLEHLSLNRLAAVAERAASAGLFLALAGSLDRSAIRRVAPIADIIGVRGAACRGGRQGMVDAALVADLRRALEDRRALPA